MDQKIICDDKISLALIFSLQCTETKSKMLAILIELSLISDDVLFVIFSFAKLNTILSFSELSPQFNNLFEQDYTRKFLEKKARQETGLRAHNYSLNELTRLSMSVCDQIVGIYYCDILMVVNNGKMYSGKFQEYEKCDLSQINNLDNIIDFCGNINTVLALDNKGHIRNICRTSSIDPNNAEPLLDLLPEPVTFNKICCGDFHGMILTNTDSVINFMIDTSGNLKLDNINCKRRPIILNLNNIIQIARCNTHALLLNADGYVYSFGYGSYSMYGNCGQLGRIVGYDETYIPGIIPSLSNVVQVTVGQYYSVVLTKDGLVYSFGQNCYGQLGFKNTVDINIPTLIPELKNIIQISTGTYHTLALRQDGKVYGFGINNKGQCVENYGGTYSPKLIPEAKNIKKVWAGYDKSLLIRKNGDILQILDNKLILRGSIPN
jgi:alpha-tubulin suppressor-like RCC1 family protein